MWFVKRKKCNLLIAFADDLRDYKQILSNQENTFWSTTLKKLTNFQEDAYFRGKILRLTVNDEIWTHYTLQSQARS